MQDFWQKLKASKVGRKSVGLVSGEFIGDLVGGAIVFGLHKFFPEIKEKITKWFSHNFVLPYLKWVEPAIDYFEHLEGEEQAGYRQSLPPAKRADEISELLIDIGLPIIPGWIAKIATRSYSDRYLGVQEKKGTFLQDLKKDWPIIVADEGVHLGAMLAMNSFLSKPTQKVRNVMENIVVKLGFSREEAQKASLYGAAWVFPNIVGLLAALGITYAREGLAPAAARA